MFPRVLAALLFASPLAAQSIEQFLKPLFPTAAATSSEAEFRELLTAACNGGARPGAAQTACNACPSGSGLPEDDSPSLFALEFDRSGHALSPTLLTAWNSAATCGRSADGDPLESERQDLIQSVWFPDLDGDGVADLSVRIRSTASKLVAAETEAYWPRILSPSPPRLSMPPNAPVHRLDFLRR